MSAGVPEDVLRSLRRYVWLMLNGKPWKARLQRTRVEDDERPVVVVEESSPLTTPLSRVSTLSQGDVQKAQTFAVVCYPSLAATAAASAHGARQVAALLDAGFSRGLVTDDVPPKNIGAPWYVPVYDFDGVPVEGEPGARSGPEHPYMQARVEAGFNVRALQDPLDELRYTVVASVPMMWWAGGRIPPRAPVVRRMPDGYEAPPEMRQVPLLPDRPC